MATFLTQRKLTRDDMIKVAGAAVGAGVAVGLVTAYVTRLIVQRERLEGGRSARVPLDIRVERSGG
jgi:hypothetical protein